MNRLPFKFLRILVASALLPLSGFGQMPPAVAARLQQSINALHLKTLDLQAQRAADALFLQELGQLHTALNPLDLNNPAHTVMLQQYVGALNQKILDLQAQRSVNAFHLQELRQLHNNLNNPALVAAFQQFVNDLNRRIHNLQAQGNASALFLQNLKQLRTNLICLYQAANTPTGQLDITTIGAHLHTNLQQSAFTDTATHAAGLAAVPASPFTVDSGKTAWNSFPGNIPLHASARPGGNINPALANDMVTLAPIDAGLLRAINNANAIPFLHPYAVDHGRIVDDNCACFCNMNSRLLQPGEVLVRCTENGALEPGEWWVNIGDMPLSIANCT
jgi:hypothetical protein